VLTWPYFIDQQINVRGIILSKDKPLTKTQANAISAVLDPHLNCCLKVAPPWYSTLKQYLTPRISYLEMGIFRQHAWRQHTNTRIKTLQLEASPDA
jgi:hypothetical protein